MRINQLPSATEVAQNDVLAIDTSNGTYQVPRSVLAPSPYIATIPTGQWSGSDSDYYITVTASNVTADSILYPFFDSDSEALLTGPVWAVPAAGSFTIHTSAIPAGTVTISVLLAGVVGEAQYQVLSDVYSKSQVDSIVAQSTANGYKLLLPWSNYSSGNITLTTPFPSGRYLCAIQFGDNGRFFHFFRKPATYASDEILSFNCGSAGNAIVTFSSASVINVQLPSGIYLKTIGAYTGINLATT